ncbi:MAG TPA: urease accessory protein UreD [Methylomirabilota bacterium]|nr:urease accessory protein UreD [Methylomirabilota bacterium]
MSLAPSAPGRVGRDGALHLAFERRGAATVLAACRSTLPLQVLAPVALDDPAAVVSMLNPTGGVLSGDRLTVEIDVGAGAHACLTTPSATRVYRSGGAPAVQTVHARLAPGAICEWVPDHTIPSPGAILDQSLVFEVGQGATLLAIDAWAAGRVARGEAWSFTRLASTLTVSDDAGPLLHDRFVLAGGRDWSARGFTDGCAYFASVALITDAGFEEFLAALPLVTPALGGVALGAARLARRGALVRCVAQSAPALTGALQAVWALARRTVLAAPPLALRKG